MQTPSNPGWSALLSEYFVRIHTKKGIIGFMSWVFGLHYNVEIKSSDLCCLKLEPLQVNLSHEYFADAGYSLAVDAVSVEHTKGDSVLKINPKQVFVILVLGGPLSSEWCHGRGWSWRWRGRAKPDVR